MTVHVSLDLETWGTRAGCDIRSIGAVIFYPNSLNDLGPDIESERFYIACNNPMIAVPMTYPVQYNAKYPLSRDPSTVEWWNNQSAEAKSAFSNPVDLALALARFADWLDYILPQPYELRLWSHGASFDPPILEAAYHAVGQRVPWHYRSPRDTRTIFEVAGMDPHKCLEQFTTPGEVYHHALDDAIVQARAICAAYAAL